jgi:hypothetical protein
VTDKPILPAEFSNWSGYYADRDRRDLERLRSLSKTEWIAEARQKATFGEPERCEICQRFSEIAQAHHVIPLGEQYDRGFVRPNQRHVWLCPNHHALIFFCVEDIPRRDRLALLASIHSLEKDEVERMAKLIQRAHEGRTK